jgi:hypothetical protein
MLARSKKHDLKSIKRLRIREEDSQRRTAKLKINGKAGWTNGFMCSTGKMPLSQTSLRESKPPEGKEELLKLIPPVTEAHEVQPLGIYELKEDLPVVVLTDGNKCVAVNARFYAYFLNQYKNICTMAFWGNAVLIYHQDELVGSIMPMAYYGSWTFDISEVEQ